ncbi:TRAP transporter permease [Mailhella massiliensis]|uniref:TRAP transporter permease n=1 Tax=Mailhella massiliensis TaxID=1903261 RepID=UPI0023540102|nr:TRAP transporter fused permease subunit [Mailhella massiliensis]
MTLGMLFKEGRRRNLSPLWVKITGVLVLIFSAIELYGAPFGFIDSYILRGLFVSFAVALTFICFTPVKSEPKESENVPVADIILAVASLGIGMYLTVNGTDIINRWTGVDPLLPADWVVTSACVLLVLEVTRRTVGPVLLGIILVFIAYNFVGKYLPGYWGHRGCSLETFLDRMVFTYDGIFSTPLGVACTYVFMFVLFGHTFNAAGGGKFFFSLAASIAGRMRGGPAKISVIASALYGTVSGSPVSDVVTTGSITIPLMKKLGYTPEFAGAVAASACSGASILPPIMGTAAFLMVDVAGIPYIDIAIAAAIPAVIYYVALMLQVHDRSVMQGMRPIADDEHPVDPARKVLRENWLYLIPIVLLVTLIVQRVSPTVVGLCATLAVIVVSWFIPGHRMGIKELYGVLRKTCLGILTVANASAAAGMVIGGIMLTGLGGKFTSLVFAATGGQSGLCLAMVALVCIVLGMGMPVPAAYVLTATLAAPALLEFKFSLMGAHLFIVYFAAISAITPPVAVAAYAAAGISEGNPNSTGVQAVKLSIAAYLVPFVFMYRPGLLMDGSLFDIAYSTVVTTIGVACVASGLEGYLHGPLRSRFYRLLLIAGGLIFIWPAGWSDIVGFAIFAFIYAHQYIIRKNNPDPALRDRVIREAA